MEIKKVIIDVTEMNMIVFYCLMVCKDFLKVKTMLFDKVYAIEFFYQMSCVSQ